MKYPYPQTIWDFDFKNSSQSWTSPHTTKYKLEVWGAQGGSETHSGYSGGKGAYATGEITITKGKTIYAFIGGVGSTTPTVSARDYTGVIYGGYNGGGGFIDTTRQCTYQVATGGGATDFRTVNSSYIQDTARSAYTTTTSSLNSRLIVAGGGGGAISECTPHYDIGTDCGTGSAGGYGASTTRYSMPSIWHGYTTYSADVSSGGYNTHTTHNAAGSVYVGAFGVGGTSGFCAWAGGGGGYYGGCGGNNYAGPGTGGSSYAGGTLDGASFSSVAIKAGNSSIPATTIGTETGHSGNGHARISMVL